MKVHVFKHIAIEDIGCIKGWADENNHTVSYTNLYDGDELPEISSFDFLIVMGGPMGVYDTDKYKWLAPEIDFIAKAIDVGKYVLGICLGSQFIAKALGANVYSSGRKEIGWFNIKLTDVAKTSGLFNNAIDEFKVFHWHGDTFDLPEGADLFMSSEAFPNQGFICNNKVLGFQFHIEIEHNNVIDFIQRFKSELTPEKFVQSESDILSTQQYYKPNNTLLYDILNNFVK